MGCHLSVTCLSPVCHLSSKIVLLFTVLWVKICVTDILKELYVFRSDWLFFGCTDVFCKNWLLFYSNIFSSVSFIIILIFHPFPFLSISSYSLPIYPILSSFLLLFFSFHFFFFFLPLFLSLLRRFCRFVCGVNLRIWSV